MNLRQLQCGQPIGRIWCTCTWRDHAAWHGAEGFSVAFLDGGFRDPDMRAPLMPAGGSGLAHVVVSGNLIGIFAVQVNPNAHFGLEDCGGSTADERRRIAGKYRRWFEDFEVGQRTKAADRRYSLQRSIHGQNENCKLNFTGEKIFMSTGKPTEADMRSVAASIMGSVRSKRKAQSSRKNGKLGGRPWGSKDSYPRKRRVNPTAKP